jgi:REP element-mobilizing transposase RayT
MSADLHSTGVRGPANPPLAYFISYHTYGTWHHFDSRGSVDSRHNQYGSPPLRVDPEWEALRSASRKDPAVILDGPMRGVVEKTIREICAHRAWSLKALAVRTNHVHAVVWGDAVPEKIMNDFKSWSTRRLVEAGLVARGVRVWVRHGSTRYLWKDTHLAGACNYVLTGQEGPLEGDGEWFVREP